MKRIIDIYGYFARFDEMYDIDDSWFGRILVNDNNLFEGIVSDYDQTSISYVFGYMYDNSLRVIKCPGHPSELVREYDTLKEENKYEGICSVINSKTSIPIGECKLKLFPAEKTREPSEFEEESLKARIASAKESISEEGMEIFKTFQKEMSGRQKIK